MPVIDTPNNAICDPLQEVVRAESLHFGYAPTRPIIQGMSVSLEAGRLCALIGPNAAGKSTLLRLMLGHLMPWSGTVRICGQDVHRMGPAGRARKCSYVPQMGSISCTFTVEQVVAMGRHAQRPHLMAIEQALVKCNLTTVRQKVFAHLSVGQQQRAMLARAIAQSIGEGRVMLLDEPGSAMDLGHVHRTMRLLLDLARGGLGVLVVLHDLDLAARYADDIWVIDGGTLAASGPWDQVMVRSVLEPVYRMRLKPIWLHGRDRPMFLSELADDKMEVGNAPNRIPT